MQFCFAEEQSTDEQNIEDIDKYFEEAQAPAEIHGYLEYNQSQEPEYDEKNAVLLDAPFCNRVNFTTPKKFEPKSLFSSSKAPVFSPIQDSLQSASRFSTQEYNIKPVSTSYSKKYGKFSFGTMYGSFLSGAQTSHSTGLFTKYEGKYIALSTGFSKNTNNNSNYDIYSDKFYIAPELKLTKRLSLLDVMKTDVAQINKSNELVLRYSPNFKKYADEVQFELGAGQSFYDDNYVNSSIRFSTKFKL